MPNRRRVLLAALLLAGIVGALAIPVRDATSREPRTRVQALFSPEGGVTKAISARLRAARRSVDVAMYVLSSPALATDLIAAHKRGVKVRVLLDGRMSGRWSQARELEDHEVFVGRITLPRGAGESSDPHFHHKFAVIDGSTVLTGSFNWTVTAEERNHENLLVVEDKALAKRYLEVFEAALALAEPDRAD